MSLNKIKLIWLIMILITAAMWVAMWWLSNHIPYTDDLYNTVYNNYRLRRTENTIFFLFVFPAFCAAFCVTIPLVSLSELKRGAPKLAFKMTFAVFFFSFFAAVGMMRLTCSPDCYHSEVESRSFMIDV